MFMLFDGIEDGIAPYCLSISICTGSSLASTSPIYSGLRFSSFEK